MFCTLHSPVIDSTVTQEGFTLIQVLCTLYSPVTELENTVTRSPKLKTGYCHETQYRKPVFTNGVRHFCSYQNIFKEIVIYMVQFFPLAKGDIIWDWRPPPSISPPFHPKQKIYQEYVFEPESACINLQSGCWVRHSWVRQYDWKLQLQWSRVSK